MRELQEVAHRRRTRRLTLFAAAMRPSRHRRAETVRRGREGSRTRFPNPSHERHRPREEEHGGQAPRRGRRGRRALQEKAVEPVRISDGEEHRHGAAFRDPIEEGMIDAGPSITAAVSSTRVSMEGTGTVRSDVPVPCLSNNTTRANDPKPSNHRRQCGDSHAISMFCANGRITTIVADPSPNTSYAILTSPDRAKRTCVTAPVHHTPWDACH